MNIDWSKAPEGTEAAHPGSTNILQAWFRRDAAGMVEQICPGAGIDSWALMGGRRDFPYGYVLRPSADKQAWTGKGVPPVGIEIEAMMQGLSSSGTYAWRRALVVHGPLPDSQGEVLVFDVETTRPSWVDEFRPIRTPEQIAAEERERAIDAMVKSCPYPGSECTTIDCAALYDAGYRKQAPQ